MPRHSSPSQQLDAGDNPDREQEAGPEAGGRKQTLLFLGISLLCAIAVLGTRNLYDDEISSLPVITSSAHSILQFVRNFDVHPPGMYLLAHAAHVLVPSFRWMNLFPLAVLYTGLSVFVLAVAPLFRDGRERAWFLLLATLHPQLLLWGTSFRWYSWWTGLALVAVVVALQPQKIAPVLSGWRCCAIGAMLGTLFYLNYVTLLFAICLGAAMLFRYRRAGATWVKYCLCTMALFAIIAAPQAKRMVETFTQRPEQRIGIPGSVARLLAATFASEAYLPWNPLALAAGLAMGLVVAALLWRRMRRGGDGAALEPALRAILLMAGLFFAAVGLSGLGGKPRTALLLAPAMAVAVACGARELPARLHQALLLLIALWSAGGLTHMVTRTDLSKSMMVERPEQVVDFIRNTSGPGCAYVVTFDGSLSLALSSPLPPRTGLISPFPAPIVDARQPPVESCSHSTLYVVHSYLGANNEFTQSIGRQMDSAAQLITGTPQTAQLSRDPDAAGRRALAKLPVVGRETAEAARLPDYRYTVVAGSIDAAAIGELRSRLPDFRAYPFMVESPK